MKDFIVASQRVVVVGFTAFNGLLQRKQYDSDEFPCCEDADVSMGLVFWDKEEGKKLDEMICQELGIEPNVHKPYQWYWEKVNRHVLEIAVNNAWNDADTVISLYYGKKKVTDQQLRIKIAVALKDSISSLGYEFINYCMNLILAEEVNN